MMTHWMKQTNKNISTLEQEKLQQQIPLWLKHTPQHSTLPELNLPAAHALWQRFAPFLANVFADVPKKGVIQSPLLSIHPFQAAISTKLGLPESGKLWLKSDDQLPIAGSVKARGGIFEVCLLAEQIAQEAGLLDKIDNYTCFATTTFQQLFKKYHIIVGSTGNLGLSIGTISAALGFRVSVHMSADAKAWKKAALRVRGVQVIEHAGAYHSAVAIGRKQAEQDPFAYFIDDEHSLALMTGYATAAEELKNQLRNTVDAEHPLYVYLPCGVGGAPAGIAYGLKQQFGQAVHCVIVEPTAAPALLLSVAAKDLSPDCLGLDGKTIADGLAVTQASAPASAVLTQYAHAFCTVADADLQQMQAQLFNTCGHYLEPSACAGLVAWAANIRMGCAANAQHIVWATGGGIVPIQEQKAELEKGCSAIRQGFRLPERIT